MARIWVAAGAVMGLLALLMAQRFFHVAQGELALAQRYVFDIANTTHFIHALLLVAIGALLGAFGNRIMLHLAGAAVLGGTLLFSGGIYASFNPAAENVRPLIPVGGVLLFAGWALLLAACLTLTPRNGQG